MKKPEHYPSPQTNKKELEAELARIEALILLNEANENVIERTTHREKLLERQDILLDEIEAYS